MFLDRLVIFKILGIKDFHSKQDLIAWKTKLSRVNMINLNKYFFTSFEIKKNNNFVLVVFCYLKANLMVEND